MDDIFVIIYAVFLGFVLISMVVMYFTARAILQKAGFNPVIAWVAIVPVVGFWIVAGLLGLAEWPVERELAAVLAQEKANA